MKFRTKARAVDLLGKGQIADLPTAITELWKNGYDAYADHLKAELFKEGYIGLKKSYFIISDDGKGMSYNDILDRWLVLGTDSKSRTSQMDKESEETLWKKPRIKAGEKGIGRLSVAYLGSPMLMLTKKLGHDIQGLYFDWRLLENYNLFLDDITIPIQNIEVNENIEKVFNNLKKSFLQNFNIEIDSDGIEIWEGSQSELMETIVTDSKDAVLEKPVLKAIKEFFNSDKTHGTLFLIFNPIEQIINLSEKDEDNVGDNEFVISSLVGFINPFKDISIDVNYSFLVHNDAESYDLLTSKGNFFDKSDFSLADVYIKGEFDGNGDFDGQVRIYDETINYSYTNPRKKDKRSFYGKVPIELGYSQGEEKSSLLTESQFKSIKDKVEKYGGLYIFRDDFRVLPYGRTNVDFLNFEKRRLLRAGTYYFTHRRMFGYLEITRARNEYLKDKSSREGLINNAQYRTFIQDAENFFVALALDYFATEAKESLFLDKKKELNDQHEALKQDKARLKAAKIAFTKSLREYPKNLEVHKEKYETLLNQLDEKLNQINVSYSEVETILDELQQLDIEFNNLVPKVPKRYKPTETQLERLYSYENKLNQYIEEYKPIREVLNKKAQDKLEIRDLKIDFTRQYNRYISSLEKEINENKQKLNEKSNQLLKEYNERSKRLLTNLLENKETLINNISTKEDVLQSSEKIENLYKSLLNEAESTLFPLIEHINTLTFEINEEQVKGAYQAQFERMKYLWEQTRDTAQLGIAVEIIDHEFNQLYARINNQLNSLVGNNDISSIKEFNYLFKNFKQLEDKYALLSPLYRISGALIKDISCNSIYQYLLDFFENQIENQNIEFEVSNNFKEHYLTIKEPVAHTVFINIINNAIYWMRNKEKRVIKLDYFKETQEIVIANSGEKIPDFRLEKIFDLFYSQRPNGRGLGLYLSKESLNEAGLDIYATNDKIYNSLNGACFVIKNIKHGL